MRRLHLLIFMGLLCTLAGHSPPANDYQKENIIFIAKKQLFYQTVYDKEFTPELLRQALYFERILSPEIVFNQAVHETGYFTSELFWVANNCFGMRYPGRRETTAISEYKYHARYKHWIDSVRDLKLWQAYWHSKGYDLTDYIAFLIDVAYATDKRYIELITNIS